LPTSPIRTKLRNLREKNTISRPKSFDVAPQRVQNPLLAEKLETSEEVEESYSNLFRGLKILL
jgi:hypothetical protein